jgi:hypothetical protein
MFALQLVHPRPGRDTTAKRARYQSPVRCPLAGAGLVHGSGYVLTRIDLLTGRCAPVDLLRYRIDAGVELTPAVERGHDHAPALTALPVIPVVTDDVTPQALVIGINSGHDVAAGGA